MDRYEELERRVQRLEQQPGIDIRHLRLSKRTIAAITTSLGLSFFNLFIRNASMSLIDRLSIYIDGGVLDMDIVTMIRPDFVTIALFLWILGAIIKYRTELANNTIPIVLFAVSFVLCTVWGYATSEYAGSVRWMDALLMCGLVHGLIVTAIAAYGWDVVNGIKKSKKGNDA